MQKIVRGRISNASLNKKMSEISRINTELTDIEEAKRRKIMCKDCKFWNGYCKKSRLARICAEKGLKNKE